MLTLPLWGIKCHNFSQMANIQSERIHDCVVSFHSMQVGHVVSWLVNVAVSEMTLMRMRTCGQRRSILTLLKLQSPYVRAEQPELPCEGGVWGRH